MWLDGLYMAEPFYAEYVMRYLADREDVSCASYCEDIVRQFTTVAHHTYDPETGLYRHAYDDSRAMFWCDSITGQSAHAWCRAMGWYAMAIVETLQYLGVNETTQPMVDILRHIYGVLPKYADPATGMWYQVLDQPGREGNYLESTGSAMFVYAQLKGVRLGYLPASMQEEALHRYEQFVERFVRENPDGTISLTDCCAVAGLGGKQMRSGTSVPWPVWAASRCAAGRSTTTSRSRSSRTTARGSGRSSGHRWSTTGPGAGCKSAPRRGPVESEGRVPPRRTGKSSRSGRIFSLSDRAGGGWEADWRI